MSKTTDLQKLAADIRSRWAILQPLLEQAAAQGIKVEWVRAWMQPTGAGATSKSATFDLSEAGRSRGMTQSGELRIHHKVDL